MANKMYNVWLHVEEVYVDEDGEEVDWGEDIDMAKVVGPVSAEYAQTVCDETLADYESAFPISIPREDSSDDLL